MLSLSYRVNHQLADVALVDLDFECYTVSPILPGLGGNLAEAAWQMMECPSQSQRNPVHERMGHPVHIPETLVKNTTNNKQLVTN